MGSRNVVRSHHALCRVCLNEERVCRSVEVEQETAARSRCQRGSEARRDEKAAAADRERHVAAVVKHNDVRDHGELNGAADAVLHNNERESKKQKRRAKQSKAEQSRSKQNKAKQHKTTQNKTKQKGYE